ncbi:hypothetical protein D9619_011539 [Psilocybe cf. subviscida]|uniref:Uncharacterized protein n=1 Tax=Psilocybe cf. subviscida TaxID=2480587 RepID=A0A8H5BUK3_9AGAR|nr:hypothetical protein D9619_011539 [Psilocybe cf. subviscida]
MELIIHVPKSPYRLGWHSKPGLGSGGKYMHLGIEPTRIEPWYGDRIVRRSAYTKAVAAIPEMLFKEHTGQIDFNSFDFKHTLDLITTVEKNYKAEELVDFLKANTNICLISAAYAFKTRLSSNKEGQNTPYKRVLRLLQKVKGELTRRLDSFHWIWETSLDKTWIRYIPNSHELHSDPDKFANAVLSVTNDLWMLEDMQTM